MAKDENKESEIRGDEQEIVDQRLPVWRPQDADREYYRYETKKRIQHYTVPPQTIFRPAKPTPTIRDAEHKRVAVYARVSTKSKEQVSSIENQQSTIQRRLPKRPTGIWRKYTVTRANPAHRKNGVQSSDECWKMRRRRKWI